MDSSSDWFSNLNKVSYGGVDRISSLPDKVIAHILSFLPTKNAVGTCILSHRWQYLFTLVDKLDFDESLVFCKRSQDFEFQVADARYNAGLANLKLPSSFKDFVDRVLMLCRLPHISSFRLKCSLGSDCSNVNAWIRAALLREVKELDIFTYESESSVLPLSLFNCATLVVLKLRGQFEMKFPAYFQLPHLKSLQLSTVEFSEDNSLNKLISGCPLLEDLVIKGGWEDVEVIDISSRSLRTLTMDFSDGFMSAPFHRSNILLDLPNLLRFNYIDYLATHNCIKNLNSLQEARIDIILDIENLMFQSEIFCHSVVELINGLTNIKHLYLSGKCMEALNCDKFKLPIFNNLSRLELGWSSCVNWRAVLREILDSSPMLETLAFDEGILHRQSDDDYDDDKNFWSKQRKAPSCLSTSLKIVKMESFHGFDEELKIARYFLRHCKVLRKLIINWRIRTKQQLQELNKLLKIGRASEECLIEIIEY